MPANTIQGPNLARSAIAPEISATVMIANTAWKPTNAIDGMREDQARGREALVDALGAHQLLRPKNSNGLPSRPPPTSLPKAIE